MSSPSSPVPLPTSPRIIAFAHKGRDWIRGSEQCLLDLLARLDPVRFRAVVLCNTPTLAGEAARRGAAVEMIDDWGTGPVCSAGVRREIAARLHAHGAALVHANAGEVLPAIVPSARRLAIPVVAHLHIPMSDSERLHSLLHQVDVAVGVAEHVVAELRREGMSAGRVRVIPNAVDEERLSAGDATGLRESLGIPPDACVVTSVGSLIHRKGHDVSIRTVAVARSGGRAIHLLVCGDGEEAGALRSLAASLGVAEVVHFLGLRPDVGAILRDATNIYVTAAREEALPLNVLEAQWAGLPVVCSDIPAHHEAMVPGITGVIVERDGTAAFAEAVLQLDQDAALRQRMGRAGTALVAERFSMGQYVARFAALYEELLGRPATEYGWWGGTHWPRVYTAWLVRVAARRLRRQGAGSLSV